MSEASIVAIVCALLGSGVIGTILTMRKDRKEAPIRQHESETNVAEASARMALELASSLRTDLTRTQSDLEDVRQEATAARQEAATARQEASDARHENSVLWVWIRGVRERWPLVRLEESPPPEPRIR